MKTLFIINIVIVFVFAIPVYAKEANGIELPFLKDNSVYKATEEQKNETAKEPLLPKDMHIRDPEAYIATPRKKDILQLQLRSSVFSNQGTGNTTTDINKFSDTGTTANTDTVFYNDISILATPKLGSTTRLVAGIGGSFIRFIDGKGYNTLNANAGILQNFGQNMSAELGWRHRTSYGLNGLSDLTENTPRLVLRRLDWITPDLFLNTDYEFQANFADSLPIFPFKNSDHTFKFNRSRRAIALCYEKIWYSINI